MNDEAEFDHSTDNIVRSVMIYPLLSFKLMIRSLNVSIVHLDAPYLLMNFEFKQLGHQFGPVHSGTFFWGHPACYLSKHN